MTSEEKEELESVVKVAVKASIKEELGEYKVPKEQHFLDHRWLNDWREWQDSVKSTTMKGIVGLIILAVGTLMLYGFLFLKGGGK